VRFSSSYFPMRNRRRGPGSAGPFSSRSAGSVFPCPIDLAALTRHDEHLGPLVGRIVFIPHGLAILDERILVRITQLWADPAWSTAVVANQWPALLLPVMEVSTTNAFGLGVLCVSKIQGDHIRESHGEPGWPRLAQKIRRRSGRSHCAGTAAWPTRRSGDALCTRTAPEPLPCQQACVQLPPGIAPQRHHSSCNTEWCQSPTTS
jgi:hypothetical protein